MPEDIFGSDIGGVIIDRIMRAGDTDTSFFSGNYLQTPEVPGAIDALRQLVERRFGEHVFLVSKCGPRVQERTLHWFDHHHVYERTGIARDHVRFCRERHEKGGICAELSITHFVDDRLEVLGNLTTVDTRYLFQSRPEEVRRFARFLSHVKQVNSWEAILANELP